MRKIKWPSYAELEDRFWNWKPVCTLLDWSKRKSLPGFFRVPIYDVVVFVLNEIQRFDVFTRANSIAFSFFLSLFPSLLTLFTFTPFLMDFLTGFIPDLANFNLVLQTEIQRVMPGQAGDMVFNFIHDITTEPRVGLLSFGFLLAIYFSSNGMLAMMQSFEKSYADTFRRRSAMNKRLVAVGLTFLIGVILIVAVVFIILGSMLISWITEQLHLTNAGIVGLEMLRWLTILLIFYLGIAFLYRYGSATHRRFSIISPGTTLATALSVLTSVGFSFYIDEFNKYDTYSTFYGSIGTIIITMLWIQMNALVLLVGFELNAAIAVNRDLKAKQEEM